MSRPLADTFRLSLGLRHDDVQTDNLLSVINFPTQNGTVTSGTIRGIQDTRDYAANPTGGWYRQGSVELGGTNVSETVLTETQRSRLNRLPALSLVPDARAPPKGCCPTTAPVGLLPFG